MESTALSLEERPYPRSERSAADVEKIVAQNRRREYLQVHPEYLADLEHEFADPVLFERLVRRFQTTSEREKDGKAKGYSRVLEADLLRGEAKLQQLRSSASSGNDDDEPARRSQPPDKSETAMVAPTTSSPWEAEVEAELPPPLTREEGRDRWRRFLTDRFIRGGDDDFDYAAVDRNDDYDGQARAERTDAWIEDEEPSWAADGHTQGPQHLEGETGIQDY